MMRECRPLRGDGGGRARRFWAASGSFAETDGLSPGGQFGNGLLNAFSPACHRGKACILAHQHDFSLSKEVAPGLGDWERLWKDWATQDVGPQPSTKMVNVPSVAGSLVLLGYYSQISLLMSAIGTGWYVRRNVTPSPLSRNIASMESPLLYRMRISYR